VLKNLSIGLRFDQVADAIGVIGFVDQDDGAGIEAIQQPICRRSRHVPDLLLG
jgi:hypothetical protein